MSSIYDWSLTAASNASSDSDITWSEGQAPSTVNNSARAMMERVAELVGDLGGALAVGGTANGITVTANSDFTTYADGRVVAFNATSTNTAAATLNVNGIGAKAIRKMGSSGDVALAAGDIQADGIYIVRYNSSLNSAAGAWQLMNQQGVSTSAANTWTAAQTFQDGYSGGAIAGLVTGTGAGGLIRGQPSAHLVVEIQSNDINDSFSVVTHGAAGTADPSLLALRVRADGLTEIGGNLTVAGTVSGNGSGLTSLGAGNLTGTVPDAALSGSYTGLGSVTGSGDATFAQLFAATGGSASTPSISFSGDTNTGFRNSSNGNGIRASVDGTDRARIYSAGIEVLSGAFFIGNLNGNASSATTATTATTANTATTATTATNCSRSVIAGNGLTGGGELNANRTLTVGAGAGVSVAAGAVSVDETVWRDGNQPSPNQVGTALSNTTSSIIFNGGNLTTNGGQLRLGLTNGIVVQFNNTSHASAYGHIANDSGLNQTSYNTSSDERLKEFQGIYDPRDAIAIIKSDPVKDFMWKNNGTKAVGWGAQTSYRIDPSLASYDEESDNWGIDYGKRTPHLWAAMSWAVDKIEELEARFGDRIAALEGAIQEAQQIITNKDDEIAGLRKGNRDKGTKAAKG